MTEDTAADTLPKTRTGRVVLWLDRSSIWSVVTLGLIVYCLFVLLFSWTEFVLAARGYKTVLLNTGQTPLPVSDFWELLYFNFVTILTVGYGDYVPVESARVLSITESIVGLMLFGILIAVATIKVISAPRSAIVFSRYGYYCLDEERFLVIFVNTTLNTLVNAEMCSYWRQGTYWDVRPAYRAPFIRQSVWTFFVDKVPLETLISGTGTDTALRFGITGQLGLTMASAYVEYEANRILVIPNRDVLTSFEGFRNADFGDERVRRMFHYRPEGAEDLEAYLRAKRQE